MFAGPNGSGKSTLKAVLAPERLGVYLNPDELEQEIRARSRLDLRTRGVTATSEEVSAFFGESSFLQSAGQSAIASRISFQNQAIIFPSSDVNAYVASAAADFLRQNLMTAKVSFTLETVMSHPDKITLLEKARQSDYRTYLYYIATDDPAINISRVRNRVKQGGHPVPEDKIVSRYERSLSLLNGRHHAHKPRLYFR